MASSSKTELNIITDHIDIWTSAIKQKSSSGRGTSKKFSLHGIKKLRELILELAVHGKLVPQDVNDESASVLLERIAAEKLQLVKDKKIKKPKSLPEIGEEEKLFELPIGWEWARLSEAGLGSTGKTPSTKEPTFFEGNIPFIGPGQITPTGIILKAEKFLSTSGLENSSEALPGDIFMVCIGGSIGKAAVVVERSGFNQQINCISPLHIASNYLYFALSTHSFYSSVLEKSTGSATPIINRGKWEELLVPIAPLEEQYRIVAKVDELMSLCDALETQTEASITAPQTLVETLLNALLLPTNSTHTANSSDDSLKPTLDKESCPEQIESPELSFEQSWQRVAEHFDTLFTTNASIDTLKQTILQLAVMGKLVEQDPSDEPAEKLLECIAAEKALLIADKKIKKKKPLSAITDEEKPFELPNGWEWVRLGTLYSFLNGFAFKSEWFQQDGVKLLRNINIAHSETKWSEQVRIPNSMAAEYEKFSLALGDIVISLDRPIINTGLKYAVIEQSDLPCLLLQRVAKFHSYADAVAPKYLSRWLESDLFMSAIDPGRSNGVPHISTKQLEAMIFPLCSLEEQHRIVDKVGELITLCDQLKARLTDAQTSELYLADSITQQALI